MNIIGIDSETINGKPLTFQFFCPELSMEEVFWTSEKTASNDFISYLKNLPEGVYHLYGLNLEFDLIEFFYNHKKHFIINSFDFEIQNMNIKGVYGKNSFCSIQTKNRSKVFLLLDVNAFFKGSLEKLAKLFCPTLPKLKKPFGLGSKIFSQDDNDFIKYALRDSEITYHIGKYIEKIHDDFSIPYSVSVSNLAGKIFRKHYLKNDIPLPPKQIVYASLHSYHGGKNNITVDKGYYKNVVSLDINSAYPFAMFNLPSFSDISLYKKLSNVEEFKEVFPEGVYCISGYAFDCKYPIIYDHAFNPVKGDFENIWITGYELNEALSACEINITTGYGFFYDTKKDFNESPFRKFVDYFYKMKTKYGKEKNKIMEKFFKVILNGLYGKFIQSKDYENKYTTYEYNDSTGRISEINELNAGGLFNPFIATLITGRCRAMIHSIEHKYQALHTATDGIICYNKAIKLKPSTELGQLKIECEGNALILRNKLYCIYDKKTGQPLKYGLHGYQGKVDDLMKMFDSGKYEYQYIKPNKLKTSMKQGKQVNFFETKTAKLNL